MKHFLAILNRTLTSTLGVVTVLILAGSAAVAVAQSSLPRITSVTVSTVTNDSAQISFNTDVPVGAKINFGKTTAYGTSSPALGFTTPAATNHAITLGALEAGTTYHFQIEVNNVSGTTKSADRTFTTRTGTGTTGPLVLNNIVADCIDTRCQILFTPNREASVRVVWDTAAHPNFSDYPQTNIVAESSVTPPTRRALMIPSQVDANNDGLADVRFTPGTVYHYRLQAFEAGNPLPTLTTANLQFTTSLNGNDHTFSTGGCLLPDGSTIGIGQCGAGGYYCPPGGGSAVQDCTKSCGFVCPSNSTCRSSGVCESDPSLSGSPFQCNKTTGGASACYDDNGVVKNPAPAGCYDSWGKCNANTILKVQKDRGCNLWLTCETSVQTEPQLGAPAENLCLTLAACNSLNQQGQCNSYLPQGQCDNDALRFCSTDADCSAGGTCNLPTSTNPTQAIKDLTYTSPVQVKQIANLSGNVVAGLDWNNVGGSTVIQGNLPWQLMRQYGGTSELKNGDFEYNPPNLQDWVTVPESANPQPQIKIDYEEVNVSTNHVMKVIPAVDINDGSYIQFSGAASGEFTANSSENYYAEARVRSTAGNLKLRFQFGFGGYQQFQVGGIATAANVTATTAWQRVTIGPFTGMVGETRVAVVCANTVDCGEFWIDDVQVRPYLQTNTNPTLLTPSCRLYPKADSPACDYIDANGVMYKGWKGFCLENDSVTGTCLSWWPVDVIKGEANIFGTEAVVGYNDRNPLFLCAESRGQYNRPDPLLNVTTFQDNGGAGNAMIDDTHGLRGQEVGLVQVMTTIVNGPIDGSSQDDHCGPVEDRGSCREGKQRGICACPSNVWNTTKEASAVDSKIHFYDVEYFAVVPQRTSGDFPIPRIILSAANNWDADWRLGSNYTRIKLNWDTSDTDGDPADGSLESYYVQIDDVSDKEGGYWAAGMFVMKERCTKLVQVVKPGGQNQSFARRVSSSSSYVVPTLQYRQNQDITPFGGVLQPKTSGSINESDPSTWGQPLAAEEPDALGLLDFPYQARSGSAYSCEGGCRNPICSTRAIGGGGTCNTSAEINTCHQTNLDRYGNSVTNPDDPSVVAKGRCIGVPLAGAPGVSTSQADNRGAQTFDPAATGAEVQSRPLFAQTRMQRLFAQSYGIYDWTLSGADANTGQYIKRANSDNPSSAAFVGWRPPSNICGNDPATGKPARNVIGVSDYPNDYCAVPPSIVSGSVKFLSGSGNNATVTGGSGSIGLKFNTDADPDQTPLQEFTINWGDTTNSYAFPYAPRNDPSKPHIFSHVYNNTGPTCSGGNTIDCCTITNGRKTCNYEIRIQVKDNWGWCNDATRNGNQSIPDTVPDTKCQTDKTTWYDTGLTVRVEP